MRPAAGDDVVHLRVSGGARAHVSSTAVRGRWVGSRRGAHWTGCDGNAATPRPRRSAMGLPTGIDYLQYMTAQSSSTGAPAQAAQVPILVSRANTLPRGMHKNK